MSPEATGVDRAILLRAYTTDDWSRVLDALEAYETALCRIGDDVRRREGFPPYDKERPDGS